ncbi:MAG: cupin domain-containing protein [Candidatus Paceibacterota bacterium]|jgi:mannose-6-phosphate isomerase-like protein (cupin superfamily)
MKGFVVNLEEATKRNENFRQVLYTAKNCQLVLMCLQPNEDIGEEIHQLDQFIRVEAGEGKAILNGVEHKLSDGFAIIVPAGARHNIVNTSASEPLLLYTVYAPPNHLDGTIHKTKTDAVADESEHFDGITSE